MLNYKSLLAILSAFILGFMLSDFRYRSSVLSENSSIDEPQRQHNTASLTPAVLLAESPAGCDISADSNGAVKSAFSWQQVNRLIVGAYYDEAIRLLEAHIAEGKDAGQVWLVLATVYKKQGNSVAAVDAWFRAVKLEADKQKIEKILVEIRGFLLQIKSSPSLFNDDYSWLIAQFDELLKYLVNDGELHLILAELLLQSHDAYQAQYHALMAVNDPAMRQPAEAFLNRLNGEKISEDLIIPLVRMGNQFLVAATIEGFPARLLIDTGASLSGLSGAYTEKYPALFKAAKPIHLNTASGVHDSFLFTVTDITIGSLVFTQHMLAQLPMDNSQGFDGLLGIDILGRFDFFIDQDAGTLKLRSRRQR